VALDSCDNVVVTGFSVGIGSDYDCYTAKYAAAGGALLWEKRYNDPENGNDRARVVGIDNHGNAVVTGVSNARVNDWGDRLIAGVASRVP